MRRTNLTGCKRRSPFRAASFILLRVNFFFQLVQIDPALCFLLQLGLQHRLLFLKLLESHIIAAAPALGCLALCQSALQGSELIVDGLKFQLLLVGEF